MMETNRKINVREMIKIMPKEKYTEVQIDKQKEYTEWCITKYEINDKKYATISLKKCNEETPIYLDGTGEVIKCHIDEKYDKYVKEKYYWYANPI